MPVSAQVRAIQNYRKRLSQSGVARFEVLGLDSDRELIRAIARKLLENNDETNEIRASLQNKVLAPASTKGGILAALRRSPMVGADLDLKRQKVTARKVDL
jgi:hypothetical protein